MTHQPLVPRTHARAVARSLVWSMGMVNSARHPGYSQTTVCQLALSTTMLPPFALERERGVPKDPRSPSLYPTRPQSPTPGDQVVGQFEPGRRKQAGQRSLPYLSRVQFSPCTWPRADSSESVKASGTAAVRWHVSQRMTCFPPSMAPRRPATARSPPPGARRPRPFCWINLGG